MGQVTTSPSFGWISILNVFPQFMHFKIMFFADNVYIYSAGLFYTVGRVPAVNNKPTIMSGGRNGA